MSWITMDFLDRTFFKMLITYVLHFVLAYLPFHTRLKIYYDKNFKFATSL